MPIPVVCSKCGNELNVPDRYAGRQVKCTNAGCDNTIQIPDPSIHPPPPPQKPLISVVCSKCGNELDVPDRYAGRQVKCTSADCGNPIPVPPGLPTPPPPPPKPLKPSSQACSLLRRRPLALMFYTLILVLSSILCFWGLVTIILQPVFMMGYILAIYQLLNGEPVRLDAFIDFMRRGWNSLWHLFMMFAAFLIMVASALAPLIMLAFGLYLVFALLGVITGSASSILQDVVGSSVASGSSLPFESSPVSGVLSLIVTIVLGLLFLGFLIASIVIGIAIAILYCYFVYSVATAARNDENEFDLVSNALRGLVSMMKVYWREVLKQAGHLCILCLAFVVLFAVLFAVSTAVAAATKTFVSIGITALILLPVALVALFLYSNVYVVACCKVLKEKVDQIHE